MKPIAQATTSLALSIMASVVASWLLRRLIFLAEQPGTKSRGEPPGQAIVVVLPIIVGNTIASPTILPQHGKRPAFKKLVRSRMRK